MVWNDGGGINGQILGVFQFFQATARGSAQGFNGLKKGVLVGKGVGDFIN